MAIYFLFFTAMFWISKLQSLVVFHGNEANITKGLFDMFDLGLEISIVIFTSKRHISSKSRKILYHFSHEKRQVPYISGRNLNTGYVLVANRYSIQKCKIVLLRNSIISFVAHSGLKIKITLRRHVWTCHHTDILYHCFYYEEEIFFISALFMGSTMHEFELALLKR